MKYDFKIDFYVFNFFVLFVNKAKQVDGVGRRNSFVEPQNNQKHSLNQCHQELLDLFENKISDVKKLNMDTLTKSLNQCHQELLDFFENKTSDVEKVNMDTLTKGLEQCHEDAEDGKITAKESAAQATSEATQPGDSFPEYMRASPGTNQIYNLF